MWDIKIKEMIAEALVHSVAPLDEEGKTIDKSDLQRLHSARSQKFVESIATVLRKKYAFEDNYRVFSKYHADNRVEFNLNELLFDILVCETNVLETDKKKHIRHVSKGIWAIESELSNSMNEVIWDFNKLILGASENKLFIGSVEHDSEGFLDSLNDLAKLCNSNTYLALVPPPKNWDTKTTVRCWKYFNHKWNEM